MRKKIFLISLILPAMAALAFQNMNSVKGDTSVRQMIYKDNDTFNSGMNGNSNNGNGMNGNGMNKKNWDKPMWQDSTLQGYYFKGGKLMQSTYGKSKNVTGKVMLDNGTSISTEGMIRSKGGTMTQLKNGDWIDMNGTVTKAKK